MDDSLRTLIVLVTVTSFAGCKTPAEARYVFRSPDIGVVAMPADTPENRERAFALMQSHFPEGYEIVAEGEEAVVAPLPTSRRTTMPGPRGLAPRPMYDPVATAAWTEPGFQREVENLPGTPQSMKGYSQPPAPSVGVHIGDPPPTPTGAIRSEWRVTYRRKGAQDVNAGEPQSLFPAASQAEAH